MSDQQTYTVHLSCPAGEHQMERPIGEGEDALSEARQVAMRTARQFLRANWKTSITHAEVNHGEEGSTATTVTFSATPEGFAEWQEKLAAKAQRAEEKAQAEAEKAAAAEAQPDPA